MIFITNFKVKDVIYLIWNSRAPPRNHGRVTFAVQKQLNANILSFFFDNDIDLMGHSRIQIVWNKLINIFWWIYTACKVSNHVMTVGLAEIRSKTLQHYQMLKTFRQEEDKCPVFQIQSKNHWKTSKKLHQKHFCNILLFHQDESYPKLNLDRSIFLSTQCHPTDFEFEQPHELLPMI